MNLVNRMVTVQEALSQISKAEESATKREQQLKQAEAKAQKIRIGGTVAEQFRFGTGARLKQARQQAKQQREQVLSQIQVEKKNLELFKQKVASRRSEVTAVQRKIKKQQELVRDIESARKFARDGVFPFGESRRVRKFFVQELRHLDSIKEAAKKKIKNFGLSVGAVGIDILPGIVDFKKKQSSIIPGITIKEGESFEKTLPAIQSLSLRPSTDLVSVVEQTASVTKQGGAVLPVTRREFQRQTGQVSPSGVVAVKQTIPNKKGERLKKFVERTTPPQSLLGIGPVGFGKEPRELTSFRQGITLGIFKSGLESLSFGKELITKPVSTTKKTFFGIGKIISNPVPFIKRESEFVKKNPAEAIGRGIAEVLLFKGTGKLIKASETGLEIGRTVVKGSKFRPVVTRQLTKLGTEEKFISGIPEIGGKGEIALIPSRLERKATTLRPSVRGGFGFTQKEQEILIKQQGPLVSAQANFPSSQFGKPLSKEFFTTPPLEGTGFVRTSRLGVQAQKEATLKDVLSLDFTIKKNKPSIIVFPEKKGFNLKATPGTELEVVAPIGRVPKKIGEPAVTLIGKGIKKRRVPIVTAEFIEPPKSASTLFKKIKSGERLSFRESRTIRKVTGFNFSSAIGTRPFLPIKRIFASSIIPTIKQSRSSLITKSTILNTSPSLNISSPRTTIKTKKGSSGGSSSTIRKNLPLSRGVSLTDRSVGLPGISRGLNLRFPTPGIIIPRVKRSTAERKKKTKKTKTKKKRKFKVAPSFTAVTTNLRGKFPKQKIKGLGLLPSQLRVIPR